MYRSILVLPFLLFILQACSPFLLREHRMMDAQGTEYNMKQVADGRDQGPMVIESVDGKIRCEGPITTRDGEPTADGIPFFYYIKDPESGIPIPHATTSEGLPPTLLTSDLQCNDGTKIRCEGRQKDTTLTSKTFDFIGHCQHPSRGSIKVLQVDQ